MNTNGALNSEDYSMANTELLNTPPVSTEIFDVDMFEGDILPDPHGDVINIEAKKWPKAADGMVYIPISFPDSATKIEKAAIARTIMEFENKTCIRYV